MAERGRASGTPASIEEAREASDKVLDPVEEEILPEERKRQFRTPGFSRMRFSWKAEDSSVITQAKAMVDGRILADFQDAYQVMFEIYDLVRTPDLDEKGEPKLDQWRLPLWKKTASGSYEEDWTKLTVKQKENLLFTITTRIFEWEQRKDDAWIESMMAKAQWEERFAIAYDAPMSGTVDDRKAVANKDAAEERYFAIFTAAYSRKADSLVRSLALLGQRLKDSMA